MEIKRIKLIALEVTEPFKVSAGTKIFNGWEVEPRFTTGYNIEGKCIQNIEILVVRFTGLERAEIKVMSTFHMQLASEEYRPTTDEDFLEYAGMLQIAIAHARAFFLKEATGSKFADAIIAFDSFPDVFQKVQLAFINSDRVN
jgi:hypothetical protein